MTRPNQAAAVPANAAGSPKTKRRFWTAAEDECLRLWYAGVETDLICQVLGRKAGQVHQRAGALGLKKSIELRAKLVSQAMAKPGHPGRQCQFKVGTKPWNTGLTGVSGQHVNSRKTQFKRGTVPHTWVPVGSVRVVEGVLERKFSNVPGAPHLRWRSVARLVWEGAHGPVPAGHVVAFKPGMHTTDVDLITLDRVELLSRAELVRRNSIHHWPPELADVARLRGSLKRAINRKMKAEP